MSSNRATLTFGVVADTHLPDRVKRLPDFILHTLEHAQVDRILHAGDACNWNAIRTLEQIAPVSVVLGNRDWFFGMPFPGSLTLTAHNVNITLTHGHRTMFNYLVDKGQYLYQGYRFRRYYRHLVRDFPNADVIIFGHTHRPIAQTIEGCYFFNPGAAYPCRYNQYRPEMGILSITEDGCIHTQHLRQPD